MKNELIITDNIILKEEIDAMPRDLDSFLNTSYVNNTLELSDFLAKHKKIDLVIIDNILDLSEIYRIRRISKIMVNLVVENTSESCINLIKPFRISELLDIVNKSRKSKFLYEIIAESLIFDQESSLILDISSGKNISLTEKENTLITGIFTSKHQTMSKEEILQNIWGYAKESETLTLETHISRLKNKIPANVIISKDGNIQLDTKK